MELASLLTAGMLWLYKIDHRPNISESEMRLGQAKEKMARMEHSLRHLSEENEQLSQMLRKKSQEMANLLISIERKNASLELVKKCVLEIIGKVRLQEDKSILATLLDINAEISNNIEGDSVLQRFEKEYDAANNGFIQRLSSLFPTLNVHERMACAYLRMNLSTKEMASMLNLSVRGVETIRYNVRKKLGLAREDNLTAYLVNF